MGRSTDGPNGSALALLLCLPSLVGCFDFAAIDGCPAPWRCEGFENGEPWPDEWLITTEPGSRAEGVISNADARAGRHALRINLEKTAAQDHVAWRLRWAPSPMPPPSARNLFARAFVKVTAYPARWVELFHAGTLDGTQSQAFYMKELGDITLSDHDDFRDGSPTLKVPIGRWTCIEWEASGDPAGGVARAWIDEALVGTRPVPARLDAPPLDTFGFGAGIYGPGDVVDFELWIDDLVVLDQRIYCRD